MSTWFMRLRMAGQKHTQWYKKYSQRENFIRERIIKVLLQKDIGLIVYQIARVSKIQIKDGNNIYHEYHGLNSWPVLVPVI